MVFGLVQDIFYDPVNVGPGIGERPKSVLPCKFTRNKLFLVQPCR